MGFGGSYDWWKSYVNSWNACFHSAVVSVIHYFSGICISAPEKTKYQAGDKDRNRGIYKRGRYRRNRKKQTVIYLFFTQAGILNKQDCALMTSLL